MKIHIPVRLGVALAGCSVRKWLLPSLRHVLRRRLLLRAA